MTEPHPHTPGPWSYRSQPHDDWGVVRAGRNWICQAKDPRRIDDEALAEHRRSKTDPWEGNARLISAAPDFAEVAPDAAYLLEQYAAFIRAEVKADELERHPYLPLIEQVAAELRAASAKASGTAIINHILGE